MARAVQVVQEAPVLAVLVPAQVALALQVPEPRQQADLVLVPWLV